MHVFRVRVAIVVVLACLLAHGIASAQSFTGVGAAPASAEVLAPLGDVVSYTVSGTFVGTVVVEQSQGGGSAAWTTLVTLSAPVTGTFLAETAPPDGTGTPARYRFRCSAYTSGMIVAALSSAAAPTGGVAPGLDTQVLFNDAGSFGGDANLTFNKATSVLAFGAGTGSGSFGNGVYDIYADSTSQALTIPTDASADSHSGVHIGPPESAFNPHFDNQGGNAVEIGSLINTALEVQMQTASGSSGGPSLEVFKGAGFDNTGATVASFQSTSAGTATGVSLTGIEILIAHESSGTAGATTAVHVLSPYVPNSGPITTATGIRLDDQTVAGSSTNFAIDVNGKFQVAPDGAGVKTAGTVQTTAVIFSALASCSSGLEGSMRAVTDSTTATWGATISGGSTNHVLAYCDGTNWTVMAK